jgi:PEP-CTERM motif
MNRISSFGVSRFLPLLFCALIAIPSPAKADPIVIASPSFHIFGGSVAAPGIQPELDGSFFFAVFTGVGRTARLFEVPVPPTAIGRTFRVTPETDPDFAAAAAALTDGIGGFVEFGLLFADGFGEIEDVREGQLFHPGAPFPEPDPDLEGFTLTAITARLDRVVVDATPTFRAVDFSGVLSFEGFADTAVPEPGTLTLLGTAIALRASRALRSRSRQRATD